MKLGGEQDLQADITESGDQNTTETEQVETSTSQTRTDVLSPQNTQKHLNNQVRTSEEILEQLNTQQQTLQNPPHSPEEITQIEKAQKQINQLLVEANTPITVDKEQAETVHVSNENISEVNTDIVTERVQETTDPKNKVVEELKTSKVYDLVLDQNNNSYAKMPSIKFDQHGGQQNVTRWLETNKIANININNWREDTDNQGEIKKWIYNSTERPEIPQGVNIEEEGITDEDMAEILSPTAHEEAKEKDEKTITPVQEEEYIDPKILESVHKANVYDSVLDKDGNNFVKMPQILTDEHGGEKHISRWVNLKNLGNIHIDNWQDNTTSETPIR